MVCCRSKVIIRIHTIIAICKDHKQQKLIIRRRIALKQIIDRISNAQSRKNKTWSKTQLKNQRKMKILKKLKEWAKNLLQI